MWQIRGNFGASFRVLRFITICLGLHWILVQALWFLFVRGGRRSKIPQDGSGKKKWKNAVYTIMQTAVWVIWKALNEAIFKGKQPRVSSLIEEIKVLGYLWFKSRAKAAELTWEEWSCFNLLSIGI
ncbi:hypothetical protein Hanom_Chr10g00912221 [Helianthus anomalus]